MNGFVVGQQVKIVGKNGHNYNIGDIVVIKNTNGSSVFTQRISDGMIQGIFNLTDLQPLEQLQPQVSSYSTLVLDGAPPVSNYPMQATQPLQVGITSVEEKPKKPKKEPEKVRFETVVLDNNKKEEIQAAISQIDNENLLFDTWGFSEVFEKGTAITLLFYGLPGTGKTLMAQAIADSVEAELKIYGMAEIGSSEPGGSERFIKKLFEEAKAFFKEKKKHRVILFDECDALLYDRNKVGVILGAQINTLLTEIERHDGIIIFTTNRIGTLDPALERRIAAKIEFPFPDRQQREAIWIRMIPKKAPLAKDVNFKELAKYPMAGGNIKNAVLNAARMAAYKGQKTITMKNFVTAIEKEFESQKAFEKQQSPYETSPIDYGFSESRKLQVDSVLHRRMDRK